MNKLKYVLATIIFLATTAPAVAGTEVSQQMKVMAGSYRTVLNATSTDEFKQALTTMREAAVKSEEAIPPKLEGKSEAELQDYRNGMVLLIELIDQANLLAEQGKLDEAKQIAEEFKPIRNEYHTKYK